MPLQADPLVSIIIPVYNGEKYLAAAIESALAQDWERKEIIVVNDGSTDRSLEIIESYRPLLTLISQKNNGACSARNAGLRAAAGDYIQYLDQDDLLHPEKISLQIRDLREETEATLACGRLFIIGEDVDDYRAFDFFDALDTYTSPVDWMIWSFEGRAMQSSVWLIPRKLHEQAGYWNEELRSNPNDDGELFCRIVLASDRVKFNREAKIYFREHEGPRGSRANDLTKITSLYRSLELSTSYLLAAEDSRRTRHAAACTFKHFAYAHCQTAPDMARQALEQIKRLGFTKVDYEVIGGRTFRLIDKTLGAKSAIKFKVLMNSLQRKMRGS
ncbi:MAG TPA: glycosyltransferase family 2 protein [Pyrinomonadaceae bacterium]|jgi:glycosyltransferase involved in cell wall biosynthesis